MRNRATLSVGGLSLLVLALLCPPPSTAQPSGGDSSAMSVQEMNDASKDMVTVMEESLAASFKLLEQSISSSDVAATALRTEAITAMKGLVKLSEENLMVLQQKLAENDRDAVEHEYVKISIAAAKVADLYAQVKTASGIDVDLEATQVETTLDIESSIPVETETFSDFGNDSANVLPDPPTHATPTK
jgi:hypothetical protein